MSLTAGGEDVLMEFGLIRTIPRGKHSEGLKATVYAINILLIRKGVYTQEEFQSFFVEWVEKELRRKQRDGARVRSE